jgi:hypothetical protein
MFSGQAQCQFIIFIVQTPMYMYVHLQHSSAPQAYLISNPSGSKHFHLNVYPHAKQSSQRLIQLTAVRSDHDRLQASRHRAVVLQLVLCRDVFEIVWELTLMLAYRSSCFRRMQRLLTYQHL